MQRTPGDLAADVFAGIAAAIGGLLVATDVGFLLVLWWMNR